MTPVEIKIASPEDRKVLVDLFLNLLEYLDEFGHDVLPIRENAEWFVDNQFLPAAEKGEPVLIAWHDGEAVGATFWVIPEVPVRTRGKHAMGYGTYIDPDWRRKGVGGVLWEKGIEILKKKEVDILVGVTYGDNKGAMKFTDAQGVDNSARLSRIYINKIP